MSILPSRHFPRVSHIAAVYADFRAHYSVANAFRIFRPTAPLFSGWNCVP